MEEKGLRYNKGKIKLELITPQIIRAIGTILTKGAEKYAPRNWEKGMEWSTVIGCLKRHLLAIEEGRDYDKESGELAVDHLLTNAGILATYYRTHPEYDDREVLFDKKIALDIDGVVANFEKAIKEKFNIKNNSNTWYYSYIFNEEFWEKIRKDKDFWMGIEPYFNGKEMPFDPVCYVTNRKIPKEWCMEWLEKHNFPCVPVYITNDKVKLLKTKDIDYFVEDRYDNFVDLNKAGVFAYLLTRPWNEKYAVGHKRIDALEDIVNSPQTKDLWVLRSVL
jgi:hypothetical protein